MSQAGRRSCITSGSDRLRSDEGSPGPPRATTSAHRDLAARAAEGIRPTSPTSTPCRWSSVVRTSEAAASDPTSARHPTRRPPSSAAAPEGGTPTAPTPGEGRRDPAAAGTARALLGGARPRRRGERKEVGLGRRRLGLGARVARGGATRGCGRSQSFAYTK
ncbi:hypothetical protein VPH35_066164 [Triticum aestivum]